MSNKEPDDLDKKTLDHFRHHPHDAMFKFHFSKAPNARNFLEKSLPKELIDSLDLDQLKLQPGNFIDEDLSGSQSDLLFSCNIKNTPCLIYFLCEHKSYFDPHTPRQLLGYITKIWEQSPKPIKKLPLIIPVVIYHYKNPWPTNTTISKLVNTTSKAQEAYIPNFKYFVKDLKSLSPEIAEYTDKLRCILGIMRDRSNNRLIRRWLYDALIDKQLSQLELRTIFYYTWAVASISKEDLKKIIEEVNMTQKKQIRFEDIEGHMARECWLEGKAEGKTEGRTETIIQTIVSLSDLIDDETLAERLNISLDEVKRIKHEHSCK